MTEEYVKLAYYTKEKNYIFMFNTMGKDRLFDDKKIE